LLSSQELQENCVRDYRKYADTVAILSAIFHLITSHPTIGRFIGIEHELETKNHRKVTPDLVSVYDNDTKGLIFELKWSLPLRGDLLKTELLDLKKYSFKYSNWKTPSGSVDYHDFVLVCHIDDVKRTVEAVNELIKAPENEFFRADRFAIWTWAITPPKEGERKEEMRLLWVYGKTKNNEIERMIHEPGGILISEDVLRYLRFLYMFICQKPPIQYTMAILIQNVFPLFQQKSERDIYKIKVDMIYDRSKVLFPSWREADVETIQIKKRWIREALEKLIELRLVKPILTEPYWYYIPIPTLRARGPVHIAICKKLTTLWLKQAKKRERRGIRLKRIRPKGPPKERPLPEYFK